MLSSSLLTRTLRSTTLRSTHLSRPLSTSPPLLSSLLRSTPPRFETSKVAQQPASKNVKEMGENALEEAKGVAGTVAEAVSGGNDVVSQAAPKKNFGAGDVTEDLKAIGSLAQQVPPETIKWGAAGLLPYLGTSVASVYFSRQAYAAQQLGESSDISVEAAQAMLEHVNLLQVQYGAIILSFLGAVHWGFEWSKFGGVVGDRRYILGIAPVLAGWSTLLFAGPLALVGQWAAFFGMWYADQRATTNGWTPRWYSTYRFWLTSVVGGSILVSLAAQGYYSLDPTLASTTSQLKEMKEGKRPSSVPRGNSIELGDMKAEKGGEGADAYVKFVNVEKERKAKEEEEKKAKEEEEKKKEEEKKAAASKEKNDKAKASVAEQVKKVEDGK